MTTLTQPLTAGDTKIYVADLSAWNANSGTNYNYAAIFYYTDSTGYMYPAGTYTRIVPAFGSGTNAKTNLDKTNNIITLNSAYSGVTIPAGTQVCASTAGGTYFYPFSNITNSSIADWTFKTTTFSSENNYLIAAKYIRFYAYSSGYFAGITIKDITNNTNNIIYDSSGYNNNATAVGELKTAQLSPTHKTSISKVSGQYIRINDRPAACMPKDAITVNIWQYCTTWNNPISCTEGGGWNFENSSGVRFPIYIASVGYKVAQSSITTSSLLNGWHMLTGTMDKDNAKIYIDGEEVGTIAVGSTYGIGYANNYIFIGAEAAGNNTSPANSNFVGNIADVRIYATALSADDIKELYRTSKILSGTAMVPRDLE